MDINTEKIRELADLAIEKNIAELIVQEGDKSVTIKRAIYGTPPGTAGAGQQVIYTPPPGPIAEIPAVSSHTEPAAAAKPVTADEGKYHAVTSPMVGTYYAAPSPDSPPFVDVGQSVTKGQALCIIEAMKMMNELESEVNGRVVKILVDNGDPVEFGQTLMLIDPS